MTKSSVVIYGDVSPNIIDGSSIWLMSITETLSRVFSEVHLQLKAKISDEVLVSTVKDIANVWVHEPKRATGKYGELTHNEAVDTVESLVAAVDAGCIVARGLELCLKFSESDSLAPRLWAYMTDIPFPLEAVDEAHLRNLRKVTARCRRVFAQTESARSYLESIAPEAAGKTILMPPMIPDYAFRDFDEAKFDSLRTGDELRMVYCGKLAKDWRTDEMLLLPKVLAEYDVRATLTVVGNKINNSPDDPAWRHRMKMILDEADRDPESGVTWVGAATRQTSIEYMARAHVGIGWRSTRLDSSLEISTKALEYGAAGIAPLVNITVDHIDLFGDDFPLFVDGSDTVHDVAAKIASRLGELGMASKRARERVSDYSMERAALRQKMQFGRGFGHRACNAPGDSRPKRVVIASHDLKFMGELVDFLVSSTDFEIKIDAWDSLHVHDPERSRELEKWADVVLCEWAGPNLKWYSQNKSKRTRLVARLHRFELWAPWMKEVEFDKVDCMVFVSSFFKRKTLSAFDIDPWRAVVIPNIVDANDFDRPKLLGSQFHLGIMGIVPFHKRPDRALDLLEECLETDERYVLHIRGRAPWEYPYEWSKPLQKQRYLEFYSRISQSPILREHVVFEPFGPDVANWYRRIGVALSPSENESFHLAPAEGMSSRAVPICWTRDGVDEVFGESNVVFSTAGAVDSVLALRTSSQFVDSGVRARQHAMKWDVPNVIEQWRKLLLE